VNVAAKLLAVAIDWMAAFELAIELWRNPCVYEKTRTRKAGSTAAAGAGAATTALANETGRTIPPTIAAVARSDTTRLEVRRVVGTSLFTGTPCIGE